MDDGVYMTVNESPILRGVRRQPARVTREGRIRVKSSVKVKKNFDNSKFAPNKRRFRIY